MLENRKSPENWLDPIYTMAFGESFPAALGQSSSELKRNRRVEFYLFEFK
jgi:outer membrane protein OmpA-like peptidoglycan-associated protein